jgi:prepilin-type N-terminal cleavage/methylation domain-containing protein
VQTQSIKGFSLIEVLIVLAIVGVTVAFLSQRIGKKDNRKIRRDVRIFAAEMRDLRNKARMRNATYRLVINLPENSKEKQSYWVESTTKSFLVTYDEDVLKKQKEGLKEGDKDPSGFEVDREVSKEGPGPLPDGLFFKSVEIASQKKEYTTGRIYIHFFPEGRVEEAVVHLTDGKSLHWSLAIHPLTGRVDLINKEKKLSDMQN